MSQPPVKNQEGWIKGKPTAVEPGNLENEVKCANLGQVGIELLA